MCVRIGTCVRPWVNGVFAFLFIFFSYQRQSGALIRYRYLLKKYYKATVLYTLDNIVLLLKTVYVEERKSTERGTERLETASNERNYIRSSRRLYYIYRLVLFSYYWRVDEHWENILFITTLSHKIAYYISLIIHTYITYTYISIVVCIKY